ncbi:MAG: Nodulation protein nolO (EC [uncultured Paraburkholderia sp.]|nr:MAG: Nodulation protein nolO (EC [uncultured Paraburkholderia sp.]CAH2807646.1 MAG: Nodulation protein nolO (EC [uncultured Paraburkholderia sp.]CAH2942974.1 MAG: Nodulation protein nolO (EC [uncultured Paraburkholderia sp.]CAH2943915.1 MAG: Nodulation protein nolO (EC [uncultured Paraburkholderia sp.]
MNVLGINSVYHESACSLIVDGVLVAAAEEERFNRRKHGKLALVDNPDTLPEAAIAYCLQEGGLTGSQLDAVAYSFAPALRRRRFQLDPLGQEGDWGSPDGEAAFCGGLDRVPAALDRIVGSGCGDKLHWVPHHLAHAASAFFPSGFDKSAILVIDGIGEASTGFIGYGEAQHIEPIREFEFPNSLGFVWEKLSRFLGFSEYDACKVMGLAAYGDAARYREAFSQFLSTEGDKLFRCDPTVLKYRVGDFSPLERLLGPARHKGDPIDRRHADIAAALQASTDKIVLALVDLAVEKAPAEALCYAGGVALNCATNWQILNSAKFRRLFIPSAPHDAGTAVGAALYVHVRVNVSRDSFTPYSGPRFDPDAIKAALERGNLRYRKSSDLTLEIAERLAHGQVIGWFQDRMEFGPRALGNRSLLADPRRYESREKLNLIVKRRETFRPFAPSVMAEYADKWFNLGRATDSHEFMLFACPIISGRADRIPAVAHADGTARVQLVKVGSNPRFHALLARFHGLTGVPMVLNTSFNDAEPIVCTPEDAIRTFNRGHIDTLVMGDYVVELGAN